MTAPLPSGVQPAAISRRVGAYAIDLAIAGAIAVVLLVITSIAFGGAAADPTAGVAAAAAGALLSVLLFGLVMIVWWWGVYTWMQAGRGSIGQRLLGLRLADAETGAPIGFGRALLRNLVWGLAGSIVIGYFTPLLDASSRHQGWHDSATRSMVVDVRGAAATTAGQAFAPAAQLSSDFGAPVQRTAPVEMSWPSDFPIPAQEFGVARRGAAAPQPPAPSQPAPPQPSVAAAAFPPPPASFAPAPPVAPVSPAAPAAAAPAAAGMISHVPGFSSSSPAPAAAAPAPAPAAASTPTPAPTSAFAPPVAEEPDDIDATRAAASVAPPAQRAAMYPEAPVIVVLTWDDGSRMAVYGRTLYGRNPSPEPGAVTVTVRDETLSLSKTHFEIGGDASGAWVLDRHSTNGTVLVRDGIRNPLTPGQATPLRAGDRLECGDRFASIGGGS